MIWMKRLRRGSTITSAQQSVSPILVAACAHRLEVEVGYFFFFFVAFLTAFFTAFLIAFFFAAMLCTSSLFDAARQINRRARAVSR